MRSSIHLKALASALGFLVTAEMCVAGAPTAEELQEVVTELQTQNQTLQRSLTEANRGEKMATEQLAQVRQRLEALGKNLLDGGDDRIVQAASDLQVASERVTKFEAATAEVIAAVNEYVRLAVVSDPSARLRVETSLRELDAVLGLRQKPQPDIRSGSLQQARIVSLDPESGMMVLNLGENQGAKIGMSFRLTRGSQPYGKAILAEVRKGISGAFVENLDNVTETPRTGDLAVIETQASAQ
jgi:exonuclease VII small subunit